jgi:hypothetical protein
MDFTSFCKRSNTIPEHNFKQAPRSLRCLQKYPQFAIRSSGRFGTSQCGPRAPSGGGLAKFRRTTGRDRPGAGGDRPSGLWGSIPGLGWAGRRPVRWGTGGRRRWPPPPCWGATGAPTGGWGGAIAALGVHGEAQVLLSHHWLGGEKLAERCPGRCGAWRTGAWRGSARDEEGSDPFMGDKCACLRPKDRRWRLWVHAPASAGVHGRGGAELTDGLLGARPAGRCAARGGGQLRGGLGTVRGFGKCGLGQYSQPRSAGRLPGRQGGTACVRARRRRTGDVTVCLVMLDWPYLSEKNLNFATKVH